MFAPLGIAGVSILHHGTPEVTGINGLCYTTQRVPICVCFGRTTALWIGGRIFLIMQSRRERELKRFCLHTFEKDICTMHQGSMYRECFLPRPRNFHLPPAPSMIHLEGESITCRPNNRSLDFCMSKLGIAIRNRGECTSQRSVAA